MGGDERQAGHGPFVARALSRPEHAGLLSALQTARAHGLPLSVLTGDKKPGARWTEHDMVLALALTQHEADLCPGCGQPRHESMDPANEGRYESPLPARCHACTAVEMRVLEYRDVKPEMAPGALKFSSALAVQLDASTAGRTGP